MSNGEKHNESAFFRNSDGAWEKESVKVVHDFPVKRSDGELLSIWEILQSWDRAKLLAVVASMQINSIDMARFRVWMRKDLDQSTLSLIVQCDMYEGPEMEPFIREEPSPSSDSGTVEVAGIDLEV